MLAAMFGYTGVGPCDSGSPVSCRHAQIVRMLLKKGANPNLLNADKESAADVAKGMVLANEIRNYKPGN